MTDRTETWAIRLNPHSKRTLEMQGWRRVKDTPDEPTFINGESFTRSNGSVMSRIYERLTKASRRRTDGAHNFIEESFYRQGVYDAFKALQEELTG